MRNSLTKTNGIYIVIEDSRKAPSIISKGISVQPGSEVNIGLQKTTISRLEHPYKSNCANEYRYKPISYIPALNFFEYSAKNCKSWCYIMQVIEKCGCFYSTLLEWINAGQIKDWIGANENVTFCQESKESKDAQCVQNLTVDYDQDFATDMCMCDPECQETEFMVK